MKPAVRVVNALPLVLKKAAVAAFAVAASAGRNDCAFKPLTESTDTADGGITECRASAEAEHVAFAIGDDDVHSLSKRARGGCCLLQDRLDVGLSRFVAARFAGGSGSTTPGVGPAMMSSGGPSPT